MLARDAGCAKRQQTRSLLCATSLKLERATKADLDTPELVEAMKTTERKLQFAGAASGDPGSKV